MRMGIITFARGARFKAFKMGMYGVGGAGAALWLADATADWIFP